MYSEGGYESISCLSSNRLQVVCSNWTARLVNWARW